MCWGAVRYVLRFENVSYVCVKKIFAKRKTVCKLTIR